MNAVTEAVELEAAIAEAELTDAEAEVVREAVQDEVPLEEAVRIVLEAREAVEEGDTDAGEQPSGELGEPSEKQLRQLDTAIRAHERKVRGIMGAHVADFEACDTCGGMGLTPKVAPRTHPWFKACDTCNGFGSILTGCGSCRSSRDRLRSSSRSRKPMRAHANW